MHGSACNLLEFETWDKPPKSGASSAYRVIALSCEECIEAVEKQELGRL